MRTKTNASSPTVKSGSTPRTPNYPSANTIPAQAIDESLLAYELRLLDSSLDQLSESADNLIVRLQDASNFDCRNQTEDKCDGPVDTIKCSTLTTRVSNLRNRVLKLNKLLNDAQAPLEI